MMHENNRKVIENWKAEDYANAYRDYINKWFSVEFWFSSFMPEEATMETVQAFRQTCKNFHELGF